MKRIRINSPKYGVKYALIDDEDFELVSKYAWHLNKNTRKTSKNVSFYAITHIEKECGSRTMLRMHRLIMGLDSGDKEQVDHKNHKTLDNRRCNLRICDGTGNNANRKKQGNTSSKYKGVSFDGRAWASQITSNGKHLHLGRFGSQRKAASQYDKAFYFFYGDNLGMNFPGIDHSNDNFDIKSFKTPAQKRKSSKYVGVSWDKGYGKWKSYVKVEGKSIHLGYFKEEKAAAKAYNNYAIKHKLGKKLNIL